jgi:transposase-like protein
LLSCGDGLVAFDGLAWRVGEVVERRRQAGRRLGQRTKIDVPRDRNGTFEPKIVPKRARRLGQIDEMILSLYARGLSTRDIERGRP